MTRNAVIFHHPDGVEAKGRELEEPSAYASGFLRGFVEHGGVDQFYAHTLNAEHFVDFARQIRQITGTSPPCRRLGADMIGQVASDPAASPFPGVLCLPGPELSPFAWRRRSYGNAAYSLCGHSHALASASDMEGIAALLSAPIQPWDALVCPSRSSKNAIRHVMDEYAAYLEERLGARPPIELLMPVIPRGVDCAVFAQDATASADRAQLRQGLGIDADDIVLLFVGPLSFHTRSHPLPFYIAAETAARRTGRRVHMIQAGWYANEAIEKEYRDGARALCPSVNAIFIDGRDDDVRRRIWRAADVFVSLSDNIQQASGLNPNEAMAAGLPVVVSDWGGSRETVSDGVHGFVIPTWMPAGGEGRGIAFAPELTVSGVNEDAAYDHYCGAVSQSTAVDVGACIDALSVLCNDADKRHAMGEAGRIHARKTVDWSVVIKLHQDVWTEIERRRARASTETRHIHSIPDIPLHSDPFSLFASYSTSVINDATEVRLIDGVELSLLDDRLSMAMNTFAMDGLLSREDLARVIDVLLERGMASVHDITTLFDQASHSEVVLSIGWLAKMHLVRLSGSITTVLDPDQHDPASKQAHGDDVTGELADGPDKPDDNALGWLEHRGVRGVSARQDDRLWGELADLPLVELTERAAIAQADGDVITASACLHRAWTLAPDAPDVNVGMGELLASGERYDAAIVCFRHAIQENPDRLDAHRNLGKALFLRGDEAEGIHSFRRAVRVAPEDGEARLLLGSALRRAGAVNEALQCLRIAREIEPERAEAGYQLGLVCYAMGRADDARAAFNSVLSLNPVHRFAGAAMLSMAAVTHGQAVAERHGGRKIALYMENQSDYFALRPVFGALCADHWPLFSADIREITDFRPEAILTVSSHFSTLRASVAGCPVIQLPKLAIRHPGNMARDTSADCVCVISDEERQAFLEAGLSQHRVWLTGLPFMDPVFGGDMRHRQPSRRLQGIDQKKARKTVLYMPDWRPGISAHATMKETLVRLCQAGEDTFDVVVRPHPRTLEHQPGWVDHWVDLAASCANLKVLVEPGVDYLSLMAEADLLLSDFSALAVTFLAFDAPLVLLRPQEDAAPGYRHTYRLRERQIELLESAATCLDSGADIEIGAENDVVEQVIKSLKSPQINDESRARMRSVLFGGSADGRASERTVSLLRAFLDA